MSGDNKPALVALRRRRDQVIEALSEHFANDALSVEEFEERLELAHRATALEQLELLLEDLEVPEKGQAARETSGDADPGSQALAVVEERALPAVIPEEKRVKSILSSVRREGEWRVPKRLRVLSVLGEVKIDFRDVQLPPGITEVHARSILSNVEIIVPPTLAVECEGTAWLGEFQEMYRAPSRRDPGAPLLIVSGSAVLGELKIETRLPGESARDAKRRRKRRGRKQLEKAAEEQKRLTDGS